MEKNNKKLINAWAFYDWANSSYPLVITTAIFPIFYIAVTSSNPELRDGQELHMVEFFGFKFINTALYSYVFSASFLVVSVLSPLLSGIADYSGRKKMFLKIFCYLGSLSCMGLFFFDSNNLEISMVFPFLASIGFWGSIVFYNAYLPEIVSPDKQDQVSAKGFTFGYVGSVILLVGNLIAIKGFGMPAKYAFLTVGFWWAGFAQYTFSVLPENPFGHIVLKKDKVLLKGYNEINKVLKSLKKLPSLRKYLRAYFVYNMGVQTVMLMAVLFADKEISWPLNEETGEPDKAGLIISVIIIQLIASVGAYVMSNSSKRIGNINVLRIVIAMWIGICIIAYYIQTPVQFYGLAALVGFVMGGIQSMSRSTYSKMLPDTEDHASYFSFYDVAEKLGIVLGTFAFGYIEDITGSMRNSVLALIVFFIIGFILLQYVPKMKTLEAHPEAN